MNQRSRKGAETKVLAAPPGTTPPGTIVEFHGSGADDYRLGIVLDDEDPRRIYLMSSDGEHVAAKRRRVSLIWPGGPHDVRVLHELARDTDERLQNWCSKTQMRQVWDRLVDDHIARDGHLRAPITAAEVLYAIECTCTDEIRSQLSSLDAAERSYLGHCVLRRNIDIFKPKRGEFQLSRVVDERAATERYQAEQKAALKSFVEAAIKRIGCIRLCVHVAMECCHGMLP